MAYIPENITSAWETRETTKSIIYQFMRDGLKIEDPKKSLWRTITVSLKDQYLIPEKEYVAQFI